MEGRSTIGVEFATRVITVEDKRINVQIWDVGACQLLSLSIPGFPTFLPTRHLPQRDNRDIAPSPQRTPLPSLVAIAVQAVPELADIPFQVLPRSCWRVVAVRRHEGFQFR